MTNISWKNAVSGDFNTAADWSTGAVPGASDNAILAAAGAAFTVTASTAETIASIQLSANATLDIDARTFTATKGTGLGKNAGAINIENNAYAAFGGRVYNTGVITLDSIGNDTRLFVDGATTLTGLGKLILSDNANNTVQANTSGDALTNVENTISGSGLFGSNNLAFTNDAKGIVDATGSVAALVVNTGASIVKNAGLLEGTGSAGLLIQSTTVANTGTLLAASGSTVELQSADIRGGTLATSGTGAVRAVDRGTLLDGTSAAVNNMGVFDVTNNNYAYVQGAIVNGKAGIINLQSFGNDTRLIVTAADATITGGAVVLSDNANNTIQGTVSGPSGDQVASTLTNDSTISGAGAIGNGSLTLINKSTIDATGAHSLVINVGGGSFATSSTVTNSGLLEATNPGALRVTGGLDLRSDTIANGATGFVEANGAATHVDLQGVTIQGGTLKTSAGGVIQAIDRGSLLDGAVNAVNNTGVLDVTNNNYLYLQGTINNTGSINLLSFGNDTRLRMNANTVLTGGGPVTLSDNPNNTIEAVAAADVLTNVSSTISGSGAFGNASMTFVNEAAGVLDATGTNAALVVDTQGEILTNSGRIEATGLAGMAIVNTVVNGATGGTISAAAGSAVALQSSTLSGGTLATAGSGVIETNGGDRGSVLDGTHGAVNNTGVVDVTDNAYLYLQGTINNTGVINVLSAGDDTRLRMNANTTITGGGPITLSDNPGNTIDAVTAADVLTNVSSTISGSGNFGGGALTFVNDAGGVVDATGSNAALVVDTQGETLTNSGLLEATGSAGMLIVSTLVNGSSGGTISAAAGSAVTLQSATIDGGTLSSTGSGFVQINDRGSTLDGLSSIVHSAATLNVTNNNYLYLEGTINNTGSINLLSSGNDTRLRLAANTMLTGAGVIFLNGNPNNTFEGASTGLTLTNNGNTLEGSGELFGGNNLTFVNGKLGIVDGNQPGALVVNTGSAKISNAGLIEATSNGAAVVQSAVTNTGTIEANGGTLSLQASVTGAGKVQIVSGTLDIANVNAGENVAFTGTTGTLELDKSQTYTGQVSGFSTSGKTVLDLRDITFASGTTKASYSGNTSSGVLTVTNGTETAKIRLVGNYTGSTFTVASDGAGGTLITDPTAQGPAQRFVAAAARLGSGAAASPNSTVEGGLMASRPTLVTPHQAHA